MSRREEKTELVGRREKRNTRSSSKGSDIINTHIGSDGAVDVPVGSRKTTATSVGSVKQVTKEKLDPELADRIDKCEEDEAERKDPLEDLTYFKTICGDFQESVAAINALQAKGSDRSKEDSMDIVRHRSEVVLLVTQMRRLNRRVQIRGRKAKENTSEVKMKVDSCHLDLQNLLYEIMHMKQEITRCTDFTSKDEDIDLVPLEDFYAEAPDEVSRPDVTKEDPHQQMLARLDWELKQRQQMADKISECMSLKQDIVKEIKQKADCLKAAAPGLDNILKVAGELFNSVGYLEGSKKEALDYEMAQYLPQPLYGLYVQAKSYKDVWDDSLIVNIEGNIQEAKACRTLGKELILEEEGEDDADADDQAEEGETESNKHRKSKEGGQQIHLEAKKKSILRAHPLSVILTMKCRDEAEVSLSFMYFTTLKIVTVKVSLRLLKSEAEPVTSGWNQSRLLALLTFEKFIVCVLDVFHPVHTTSPAAGRDSWANLTSLLAPGSVLCNLYDRDDGKTTPNQANCSLLASLGITAFASLTEELGMPYYWVQWLCWLKYLPPDNENDFSEQLAEAQRVENVIKAVEERVLARISLKRQLGILEKLEAPRVPPDPSDPLEDPIARTASWKCVTEEEVKNMSLTAQFDSCKLLGSAHSYYLASFERKEGTLACIIAVHTDYPQCPPLFILKVKMKNQKNVDINCVRALEQEINTCCKLSPFDPSLVLSAQIRKLQLLFDIFCDTQSDEPPKAKLFLNARSGRDRRPPLKYVTEGHLKLYIHDK